MADSSDTRIPTVVADRAFEGQPGRDVGERLERRRDLVGALATRVLVDGQRYEAGPFGVLAGDLPAGQQEVLRFGHAAQAREAGQSSISSDVF